MRITRQLAAIAGGVALLGGMLQPPVSTLSAFPQVRPGAASDVQFVNVRPVTPANGFRSPLWSPTTAGLLAFIGRDGTYTLDLATGRVEKRSSVIAGPFFVWADEDQGVVFRAVNRLGVMRIDFLSFMTGVPTTLATSADLALPQRSRRVVYRDGARLLEVASAGGPSVSVGSQDALAFQSGDHIYLASGGTTTIITRGSGKHFLPRLSPDGTKVLFQELSSGLHVYDVSTGLTVALGPGDDGAWAPTSDLVVFEVTVDDGLNVISSSLFVADLTGRRVRLTGTTGPLQPMRPTWSPDGRHLAFDDSTGTLFVADVIRGQNR